MDHQDTKLADLTNTDNFRISKIPALDTENGLYDYSFLTYDYDDFDSSNFKDLLPTFRNFKSLGEGRTPLVKSKTFRNCYIKDEGRNPSGCFKDRESSVVFPYYVDRGFKKFGIVSSGNAAVSAALYASVYRVQVKCYIPCDTSEPKKNLIKLFGAEYELNGDNYEQCYHEFLKANSSNKEICNITAGVCSLRDQGDKSIAFEIFEDIGVPDYVIVPSANGSLLFGIFNGFRELKLLGLSDKMPMMMAVQIDGAAPLAQSLKEKKDYVILDKLVDSKAEGMVAMESYCSPKAQFALRETKGSVLLVDDASLPDAMKFALHDEGIIPEWTSVPGFAALKKAYEEKVLQDNKKVVLINTGSGMKEINDILQSLSA